MKRYDLIHIHPSAMRTKPRYIYMPAGIFGMLNDVQANGYSVLAINEALEMLLDSSFSLADCLEAYSAPIFTIDLHWHEHAYGAVSIARIIKGVHPQSIVVVGGITASYYAIDLLRTCPEIDHIIVGFGEKKLVEILNLGKKIKSNKIQISKEMPDIDADDHITRDWLLHSDKYDCTAIHGWMKGTTFWLKTGFGCPMNCGFCGGARSSQKLIFGNQFVIRRSPEDVAKDIVNLHHQGISRISLTQDPSVAPHDYWQRMHRNIRSSRCKPGIYIEASGVPNVDFIKDFAKTFDLNNSIIALSPICEDEKVRAKYGKAYSNLQLSLSIRLIEASGIKYVLYFGRCLDMINKYSSTRNIKCKDSFWGGHSPLFTLDSDITLDPASPMYIDPNKYDIQAELKTFDDYLKRTQLRSEHRTYYKLGYKAKS